MGQLCSAIPLLLLWLYASPSAGLVFLEAMFMLSSASNGILALGLSTYTAELYPTEMRAVGVGIGNAWVRFAAIIGPIFLGWASANIGLNHAYAVYAAFGVIGGLTVIFVAIETKGKVLELLSPSPLPSGSDSAKHIGDRMTKARLLRGPAAIAEAGLVGMSFLVFGVPAGAADPLPASTIAPAGVLPADATVGPLSLRLDYLAWSVSGDKLPALVTTGVLGAAGTQTLYGSSTVNDDWRSGGRITAGYRFDPEHGAGVELSFFDLGDASSHFNANSGVYPNLALPFIDATTGLQNSLLASSPGLLSGSVTASDTSRFLGLRALYRRDLGSIGPEHFGALIGYRFLYESDQLDIASNSTVIGGLAIPVGYLVIAERNAFNATNAFHGIDLGLTGENTEGPWHIEWRAQLALGADVTGTNISGATTTGRCGRDDEQYRRPLRAPEHIGDHGQARFAIAPEFSLKAGYEDCTQLATHRRLRPSSIGPACSARAILSTPPSTQRWCRRQPVAARNGRRPASPPAPFSRKASASASSTIFETHSLIMCSSAQSR